FGPEAFRVRTGQVQLDRLHAVRGHLRRDGCVLLGVLAEDGADHDRARGVGPLDLMFVLDDARIREADRIQQAGIELDNRRVRIPFARLRTHALRDDGACPCLIGFWGRSHTTCQGRDALIDEAVAVTAAGNASRTPPGPTRNTCTAEPYAGAPIDQLPIRIMYEFQPFEVSVAGGRMSIRSPA